MSATSTCSDTAAPPKNFELSFRARTIGTHILFAVLTTFYWCEIIEDHQLALFRNFMARSKLIIGKNQYSRLIYLAAPLNCRSSSDPTTTTSARRSRIILLSIYVAIAVLNLLKSLQSANTCYICIFME